MAIVSMRELLNDARRGGYAVGSFSVANMECIEGVLKAAESCRAPIILQIAEVRLPYSPLHLIGPMMLAAAGHASVPVAVHLDHGKTMDCFREALDLGFTSIMCDASQLPIEENVEFTSRVVELAKPYGAVVEAEVGRVGKGEDGEAAEEVIASLDDCRKMDATGITALAVGIGNAVFAGFGGEAFTAYGKALRDGNPDKFVISTVCTDGYEGYIPTAEAFAQGGYEVQSSHFSPPVQEEILNAFSEMIK